MVKLASRQLGVFSDFIGSLRIRSKEHSDALGEGTPLVLWESQRRFMAEVAEGIDSGVRIFKCLKSRQLGITTVSLAIDIFWLAMHPGITGALVTENESNRDKNRKVLKQYMDSFPEGYFGTDFRIIGDNRQHMLFSNGSRLDFKVAGTKDKGTAWGEGEGYSFAHLTEIASYGSEPALKSFEEAYSQTNPQRLYIYESTAKGDNLWRASWEAGNRDPYTQRSFFIGWWASGINRIARSDPRFAQYGLDRPDAEEREKIKAVLDLYDYKVDEEQLCWYRWRQANAGSDDGMLDQNQPWTAKEAFIQSGQSFFQTRLLAQEMRKLDDNPPLRLAYRYEFGETFFQMQLHECPEGTDLDDIELRVWEEPVDGGQYIIGCDPAYGRTEHGDQIAIQVYRAFADRLVQVAEYATYETEVKYAAWVLAHMAGAYKDCMVNMEIYGGGEVIMNEWSNLRAMLNSEMYAKAAKSGEWTDALDMARWYLYARTDTIGARPAAYNFQTTHKTKYQLMVGMRGSYVTKELLIRSKFLLAEMMNVVQDGQSIGAPDSSNQACKDDRVFATAFAIRAWNEWYKTDLISKGYTYDIAMSEEKGEVGTHVRSLNTMVQRFFQSAAMSAGTALPAPTFRQERGLE